MRPEDSRRLLFLALLVLSTYLVYQVLKPMLTGILWAAVLVVAFQPFYRRLVGWLGQREWTAAILLTVAVTLFIVFPFVFVLFQVGEGLVLGYDWLRARVAEGGPSLVPIDQIPWLKGALDWLGQWVDVETIDVKAMALTILKTLGNALAARSSGMVADALSTVLNVVVCLATMVVLFLSGPRILSVTREIVPLADADKAEVFKQLEDVTRAVFFGVILTAMAQGILGAVGFAIVGLPAVATFGAATFFSALLPGGTVVVWGPAALYLFLTGSPWKALFLAIWGAVAVSSADNILRPLFIGRGVKLHTLLVFFGILGGMMAFGLVGLFIGPLVLTLFLFLLDIAGRDVFRVTPKA